MTGRIEWELPSPKWTYVFIGISVGGFLFQNFADVWVYGAFYPSMASQWPWTFLTSIFLHAGVQHLLLNMIALFFFGTYLERTIGNEPFVYLFLVSGIVGNVGYLLTAPNPSIPAIGASGAVYGVMGTLTVLAPFLTVYVFGFLPLPLVVLAGLYAVMDVVGLMTPSGIANGAHLGGLVIGLAFGYYVRENWFDEP